LLIASLAVERPGVRAHPELLDLLPALGGLALAVGLLFASGLELRSSFRRLTHASLFFVLLFVVLPLSIEDDDPVVFLGVSVSTEGFFLALWIFLRALSIVCLADLALRSSPLRDNLRALRSLRVPAKLLMVANFADRYRRMYSDQLRRMQQSMRIRGFKSRPSARSARTLANTIGMLLLTSMVRVQTVSKAMRARGYSGSYAKLEGTPRAADYSKGLGALALSLSLLYWKLR
ncbi:MAG: energy-coupling factor transporter transmembrane component T, partial [Planctomycetota bacterium]